MEGEIWLDTDFARQLGFTSELFDSNSYLWKIGSSIYISLIISRYPEKSNFSTLINNILSRGYTVKVPTPSPMMAQILKRKGFIRSREQSELGACEVWYKEPKTGRESPE